MNNIHGLNSGGSANRRGGNAGGGGGDGSPGCMDQIKSGWNSVPWFNKFIFTTCTMGLLLSYVLPLNAYCVLLPGFLLRFQIWRLFTGTFVVDGILGWLFTLFSYIPSAMIEENAMGTVPFAIRFLKLTIFINVLFSAVSLLLGFLVFPSLLGSPSMGLWPVIFCDMVIQCYQAPEMPRNICCFPIAVKSKYYPLVIFGLFSLFFGPQFGLLTGLGVGYLYAFQYLGCLETSPQALQGWANSWPFKGLSDNRSFRGSSSALQNNPNAGQGNTASMMPSFLGGGNQSNTATQARPGQEESKQTSAQASKERFTAFKGKGVSLGSDAGLPAPSRSQAARSSQPAAASAKPRQAPPERPGILGGTSSTSASSTAQPQSTNATTAESNTLDSQDSSEDGHVDEETGKKAKSNDAMGDYKPVSQNNNQYQL